MLLLLYTQQRQERTLSNFNYCHRHCECEHGRPLVSGWLSSYSRTSYFNRKGKERILFVDYSACGIPATPTTWFGRELRFHECNSESIKHFAKRLLFSAACLPGSLRTTWVQSKFIRNIGRKYIASSLSWGSSPRNVSFTTFICQRRDDAQVEEDVLSHSHKAATEVEKLWKWDQLIASDGGIETGKGETMDNSEWMGRAAAEPGEEE